MTPIELKTLVRQCNDDAEVFVKGHFALKNYLENNLKINSERERRAG